MVGRATLTRSSMSFSMICYTNLSRKLYIGANIMKSRLLKLSLVYLVLFGAFAYPTEIFCVSDTGASQYVTCSVIKNSIIAVSLGALMWYGASIEKKAASQPLAVAQRSRNRVERPRLLMIGLLCIAAPGAILLMSLLSNETALPTSLNLAFTVAYILMPIISIPLFIFGVALCFRSMYRE